MGSHDDRAFVVQFRPDSDAKAGRFEGRVEQVASGEGARFRSLGELLAFMTRVLARPAPLPTRRREPAEAEEE